MKKNKYYSLNEKVYGKFLHKHFVKSKIPLGQIKYHFKNFQKNFLLNKKQFKNKEILDTGAGPGVHSAILSLMGARVTAVDLSKENIKKIKIIKKKYKLKNLKYFQHDLVQEIRGGKKYDLISCHNWIQHTPNPYLILKNLSKNIKIGGKFYISCYQTNVFRCTIALIARSILNPSDFDLMMKLSLLLFPVGFKKFQNRDHAQFGLMFDDFFTPYFHTISYEEIIKDFNSLGFKPITKIPKIKNIFLEHMPYVRVGFIKKTNIIKKFYKPQFVYKSINFVRNKNKIINETYKLIKKIKKIKKIDKISKILFCISLFELSCEYSNSRTIQKYKVLNAFLDRFLTKNYVYLSDKITVKRNNKLYQI